MEGGGRPTGSAEEFPSSQVIGEAKDMEYNSHLDKVSVGETSFQTMDLENIFFFVFFLLNFWDISESGRLIC